MPVTLDFSEVLHHPGMHTTLEVDVPCSEELDLPCAEPVTGSLAFTNTGNLLVVQGELLAVLNSACPRCLVDIVTETEIDVDDEFSVEDCSVIGRADDEEGVTDPSTTALWEDGHLMNLTEFVRQAIVLELTFEPLCREDCKGLCSRCGANLNETQCDCLPEVISPFASLAGLYKTDTD